MRATLHSAPTASMGKTSRVELTVGEDGRSAVAANLRAMAADVSGGEPGAAAASVGDGGRESALSAGGTPVVELELKEVGAIIPPGDTPIIVLELKVVDGDAVGSDEGRGSASSMVSVAGRAHSPSRSRTIFIQR